MPFAPLIYRAIAFLFLSAGNLGLELSLLSTRQKGSAPNDPCPALGHTSKASPIREKKIPH